MIRIREFIFCIFMAENKFVNAVIPFISVGYELS